MKIMFAFAVDDGYGPIFDIDFQSKNHSLLLNPEVENWCRECLSALPTVVDIPSYVFPWETELNFANDADAVAFKLRWCDDNFH